MSPYRLGNLIWHWWILAELIGLISPFYLSQMAAQRGELLVQLKANQICNRSIKLQERLFFHFNLDLKLWLTHLHLPRQETFFRPVWPDRMIIFTKRLANKCSPKIWKDMAILNHFTFYYKISVITFWATLGDNWATFLYHIWSHCFRLVVLMIEWIGTHFK